MSTRHSPSRRSTKIMFWSVFVIRASKLAFPPRGCLGELYGTSGSGVQACGNPGTVSGTQDGRRGGSRGVLASICRGRRYERRVRGVQALREQGRHPWARFAAMNSRGTCCELFHSQSAGHSLIGADLLTITAHHEAAHAVVSYRLTGDADASTRGSTVSGAAERRPARS